VTHIVGLRLIDWQRFRGVHELELGPGVYALTAEDEQDAARSNYLGKTSLLRAIRWALDGKRPRTVDSVEDLVSYDRATGVRSEQVGVDIELSDGAFISRLKPLGASESLEFALPDGTVLRGDEAERALPGYLGFEVVEMLDTCIAEQRALPGLVSAGSTASTEAFERWLQTGKLAEAADAVSDELNELMTEHGRCIAARVAGLEAGGTEAEVERRRAELVAAQARFEADHAAANSASEKLRAHAELALKLKTRDERRRLLEQVEALAGEVAELKAVPVPDVEAIVAKRERELHARDEARREVERARKLVSGQFDGRCPVAGIDCPAREQINARTAENRAALAKAEAARKEAETRGGLVECSFDEARAQQRRLDQASARLDAAVEAAARLAWIDSEQLPDVLPPVEQPPLVDRSAVERARAALGEAEAALARVADADARLAELARSLAARRAALAILGPEGAQRAAAEQAVGGVVRAANGVLAEAGVDLAVSLSWGRETKELAVRCSGCGSPFPASTRVRQCARCGATRGPKVSNRVRFRLSHQSDGAAADLGGLALRTAAFRWLRARRSARWSVAALDEPLAQMDRAHRASVSAAIQRMLLGTFEQAIVSAHDRAFLESVPRRIVVRASGPWSRVEVA